MKFLLIILIVLMPISALAGVNKEFVKYTENALDALDDVEVAFDSDIATNTSVNNALNKLDSALKKYSRLNLKEKSIEKEISWKITISRLTYDLVFYQGIGSEKHMEAKRYGDEARELFKKYKMGSSRVKK
ncbi:hypothetical protein KI809_18910 [Geobacter pelophilus]|uniref:Uncharacterized protein n=1 Tax=Geoanaerobacter pelophilus TaxID=60036 RepID=A0AAW4LBA6_9BACT|nr:hypothetical protein [Geoanaerobacter pelophilus]MBT0666383.1 hypothetical protein [Geoanaerobacter pelophilus]